MKKFGENGKDRSQQRHFIRRAMTALGVMALTLGVIVLLSRSMRLSPGVRGGELDLPGRSLPGIVELSGCWTFHWNQLIADGAAHSPDGEVDVPGSWTDLHPGGKTLPAFGYATYRLRVRAHKGQLLAVYTLPQGGAYRLYANGLLLTESGRVSAAPTDTRPAYQVHAEATVFRAPADVFYLNMQVANNAWFQPGMLVPPLLGNADALNALRAGIVAMTNVMNGVLLLIICFLALLILRGENRLAALFFALACGAIILGSVFQPDALAGFSFPDMPLRLRYILYALPNYWMVPLFLAYLYHTFSGWLLRSFLYLGAGVSVVFTVLTLLLPIYGASGVKLLYDLPQQAELAAIFILLLWETFCRRQYAFPLLIGFSAVVPASISGLLSVRLHLFSANVSLLRAALFALVFCVLIMHVSDFTSQLRNNRLLVRRLRWMDELRAAIVHSTSSRMRIPANRIFVMSEQMLDGSMPPDAAGLRQIHADGEQMLDQIHDMLTYLRLQEGGTRREERFPVFPLLCGLINEYRCVTQTDNLRWVDGPQTDLPDVRGDRRWTASVLQVVFSAALEHADEQTPALVSVRCAEGGVVVRVTAVDMQIPEAVSVLWNGDGDAPPAGDDGAHAVECVPERQGGRARFFRENGRDVFELCLRTADGDSGAFADETDGQWQISSTSQDKRAAVRHTETSGQTVMLVDSLPSGMRGTALILSAMGLSVEGFCTAQEALDFLDHGGRADLAVIQSAMPDMSGIALCRSIRRHHTLLELPVLLLTENRRASASALEAGANECMFQPYDILLLRAHVQTLLQLKQAAEQAVKNENAFLQAQIKPHFLFNTLNTIASYSYINPDRSAALIGELAGYLRFTLDSGLQAASIPLESEVAFARSYLQLEQARFEERLVFSFDCRDEENVHIAPFLIQPLVENAVRHGILRRARGGTVAVRGRRDKLFYHITVEDDGVGMEPGRIEEVLNGQYATGTGVGLRNVQKRLHNLYGTSLQIRSTPGRGTSVTLTIRTDG